MLYNAHRPAESVAAKPSDFNPTIKREVKPTPDAKPDDLAFCRKVFGRRE